MSGLIGWIDNRMNLSAEREHVREMANAVRNRGPDANGLWLGQRVALAHQQLGAPARPDHAQPFVHELAEGVLAAACDGKLDNAAELKRALEGAGVRLLHGSDPELLVQGFLLWGPSLVERLEGMFAFLLYDGRSGQLWLARDRMGVKPLYYYEYHSGLLCASTPRGIMANRHFNASLDLAALPILLQPRLAMAGETPLRGLRELPPAHILSYGPSGATLRRYWKLRSAAHEHSFEQTVDHVRGLLTDAVAKQVQGGVARGAMLSGGVDSTSVAALAAKQLQGSGSASVLDTFCVQFESDATHFTPSELRPEIDAPYALQAAAFIGTHHRTLTATATELMGVIPHTRDARCLPGWGQFDASMYLIFREMRRYCRVALSGEAADEVFGGYPYFFKPAVLHRAQFPWLGDGPRLSDYLSAELRERIDPREDERARYAQLISEVPKLPGESPEEARIREVFYLGLSGPLAVILDRKDRMSMAQGLEVRVPFCDHRLVEYVWNVPWAMKSRGGVKGLLKAAMSDQLPQSTVQRTKSAYPHMQTPEYDQSLVSATRSILSDPESPVRALFDVPRLLQLVNAIGSGRASELEKLSFPGGANPAYMLIHIVELAEWLTDCSLA